MKFQFYLPAKASSVSERICTDDSFVSFGVSLCNINCMVYQRNFFFFFSCIEFKLRKVGR